MERSSFIKDSNKSSLSWSSARKVNSSVPGSDSIALSDRVCAGGSRTEKALSRSPVPGPGVVGSRADSRPKEFPGQGAREARMRSLDEIARILRAFVFQAALSSSNF